MLSLFHRLRDNVMGRGEAAITIPIFDGALKPNNSLEEATVVGELAAPEDLVAKDGIVYVADGCRIVSTTGADWTVVATFDRPITALACLPGGSFAAALDGREVRLVGGPLDGRSYSSARGRPFCAVNGLCAMGDGSLVVSDGSAEYPFAQWSHDLMTKGRTGRIVLLDLADGRAKELADGRLYAFGVSTFGDQVWFSETWKHRVVAVNVSDGKSSIVVDELPGYPCRLAPASDGGAWLSVFAGRTQLVEFVLREPGYRRRMVAEVDPKYWIAPALSSGRTFLEPLQGAGVKMRGVLKPWAPPRSYGLVVKLSPAGHAEYSFHSRLGGTNHGVVATAECGGFLFVLSKGSRRILKLKVPVGEAL